MHIPRPELYGNALIEFNHRWSQGNVQAEFGDLVDPEVVVLQLCQKVLIGLYFRKQLSKEQVLEYWQPEPE